MNTYIYNILFNSASFYIFGIWTFGADKHLQGYITLGMPKATFLSTFFCICLSVPVSCRSGANKGNGGRQQSRAKTKCCYCVAKMPSECPGAGAIVQAESLCMLSLHANGICLAASRLCCSVAGELVFVCLFAKLKCSPFYLSLSLSLFNIRIINCNI